VKACFLKKSAVSVFPADLRSHALMNEQQICAADPRLERVLLTQEEIRTRVSSLAREIAERHRQAPFYLIGVLKGACFFLTDLARELCLAGCTEVRLDFIRTSTYGNEVKKNGEAARSVRIEGPWTEMAGQRVILVDDILDQGFTLAALRRHVLTTLGAEQVETCVFLEKDLRHPSPEVAAQRASFKADYVGARVPDRWVVGYGLDVAELYRSLPFVAIVKEEHFR